MSGYNLEQLLEWSVEDRLIDGYTIGENGVINIRRDGQGQQYDRRDAEKLLLGLMRRLNRSEGKA